MRSKIAIQTGLSAMNSTAATTNTSRIAERAHYGYMDLHDSLIEVRVITIILLSAVFVHIIVQCIIWKKCAQPNSLLKQQYMILASLSLSDIFVAVSFLIIHAFQSHILSKPLYFTVAESFRVCSMIASILNNIALTVNKYIFCRFSLRYESIVTVQRTCLVIVAIWITSVALTLCALFVCQSCMNDVEQSRTAEYHNFPVAILQATVCCFGLIIIILLNIHLRMMSKRHTSQEVRRIQEVGDEQSLRELWRRNLKNTLVANSVVVSFTMFYIPVAVIMLYVHIATHCHEACNLAFMVIISFFYSSTLIHPILYALIIREIRVQIITEVGKIVNYLRSFVMQNSNIAPVN